MRRHWRKHFVVVAAAAALGVSGCSMLPGGLGGPADDDGDQAGEDVIEADDAIDDGAADDPADDATQAEPAAEGLDPLQIDPQPVDATVHVDSMEHTIEAMDVVDLDAESDRETRTEGAKLVFSGSVYNPTNGSLATNADVALQWEDPGSGHAFESIGRTSSDPVPSGASGPLEFDLHLSVEQLETFEASTALLIIGRSGASPAQIPLGDGELITRIPVPQEDLIGKSFNIDGRVFVTVEEADLRWDIGGGADDGTAVLEIFVRLDNQTDGQRCWSRGTGNNFYLTSADGTGTTDLDMSDRGCTPSGDSTVSATGITVHEDYAGDYTLTHDRTIDFDYFEDSFEFTMVDGPGVLFSER